MDLVKIGAFLQTLRKEKDLTQEELAEQVGVSRRTVSRWETGSNMPDLDVLMELCDRILVLCGGKVSGIVDGRKANKQEIGMMMTRVGGEQDGE